jgi:hypothetical protein
VSLALKSTAGAESTIAEEVSGDLAVAAAVIDAASRPAAAAKEIAS